MRKVHKIAFGYKTFSGRNTAINYLIGKHGGCKISLEEPLINIENYAYSRFALRHNHIDKQLLGYLSIWSRCVDNNMLINQAMEKEKFVGLSNMFIPDVRFENEFNYLKENGWTLVKINRNTIKTENVSEIELDKINDRQWDHVIDNNGNVANLYRQLDLVIAKKNYIIYKSKKDIKPII